MAKKKSEVQEEKKHNVVVMEKPVPETTIEDPKHGKRQGGCIIMTPKEYEKHSKGNK